VGRARGDAVHRFTMRPRNFGGASTACLKQIHRL
jgi:hypothetical protein